MRNAVKPNGWWGACLRLQVRLARRRMLALLAMGLAALLLCAGAVLALSQLRAGRGFTGLVLAVASEEEDARVDLLLDVVAGMDEVSQYATVRRTTVGDAEALVRAGGANAAVVLPEGFAQSLMTGENLSPRLILDTARPLEAMLTVQLAENASRMLAKAQQAVGYIAAVYDIEQPEGVALNSVVQEVNLRFALWVLQRDGMFRSVGAGAAGAFGLAAQYLLSAVLFFAMLCLPVLYRLYALEGQAGWLARLRGAGCSTALWMLGQTAVGALALLPLLCLLLAAAVLAGGGGFALAALPGLLLAAAFLSCFGFVCCNLSSPLASVSLVFLVDMVALVTCGGLVPLVLLPAPVAALAPLSPIGWMRDALAPLFGAPINVAALLALGLATLALLGLGLLLGNTRQKRGA